jgi:hypothetical protein
MAKLFGTLRTLDEPWSNILSCHKTEGLIILSIVSDPVKAAETVLLLQEFVTIRTERRSTPTKLLPRPPKHKGVEVMGGFYGVNMDAWNLERV